MSISTDDDLEASPAAPRRGRSVRGHLAIFTAVLALPILLFVGLLLWRIAAAEQSRLEGDAADLAQTIALLIDRDTAGLVASLDVLSLSAALQLGNLATFHEQASDLSQRQGIVAVLSDVSGKPLVNVRLPWGAPLPDQTGLPDDRDALATGRPFITDVFTDPATNKQVFAVATPVSRTGAQNYILHFSVGLERYQRLLSEVEIPPSHTVSIIDRAGLIMARNLRPADFVGKPVTAQLQEQATARQGTLSGRTVEGTPVFIAYARSGLTKFRVAVGVPYSELNSPLWRSLSLFAALGIVIAAVSTLLGWSFGGRITRPIRQLAGQAAALGRQETVPELSTGLREVDDVGAELAAAAAQRAKRETELREANEEIQRFAYIVSHDLRSPLVNIMGFTTELEALRDDVFKRVEDLRAKLDEPGREGSQDERLKQDFDEAIGFIKASIGKMDRLINAILRLSREGRREFRPERVDMNALLAGIKASLTSQADSAGATVTVSDLPGLISDRLALEQIFSNLVDNALKYLSPTRPGLITVSGYQTGGSVVYEVRDNGRGIADKDQGRVFELFRRAGAQDKPGEGIGLAHVQTLVRRLGGTIGLTSQFGQGSVFSVTLPRRWPGKRQRKAE